MQFSPPAVTSSFLAQNPVLEPVSVGARWKAWVCGRSIAGVAGSNPAWVMNVLLL